MLSKWKSCILNFHDYICVFIALIVIVFSYLSMHLEEFQEKDARCRQNETMLWKLHVEQFTQWIKDKIYVAVGKLSFSFTHI